MQKEIGFGIPSFYFHVGLSLLKKDWEYPSWDIPYTCPLHPHMPIRVLPQIQWCTNQAAWTHLIDLQLVHTGGSHQAARERDQATQVFY